MKINTKFWIIVCVGSLLIIITNFYSLNKPQKYIIKRNFENSKFKIEKVLDLNGNVVLSDKENILQFTLENEDNKFVMKGNLTNLLTKNNKKVISEIPSIPLFLSGEKIFFKSKFKIGYTSIFQKNEPTYFNIPNFKVINMFPVDDKSHILIALGEQKTQEKYITGFYIIDLVTLKTKTLKAISSSNYSKVAQNNMIYQGNFSQDEKNIIYNFDKISKIFIFDKMGHLKSVIATKENVPTPKLTKEIRQNDTLFLYKRGETFSTNIGSAISDDTINVFSSRVKGEEVIIDKYLIPTQKYITSSRAKFMGKSNQNINYVFSHQGKIYIVFDNKLTSVSH